MLSGRYNVETVCMVSGQFTLTSIQFDINHRYLFKAFILKAGISIDSNLRSFSHSGHKNILKS